MKIGIYSGSFDPVHSGHLEFASSALRQAGLDKLYFLPERLPRHKPNVSSLEHRIKMLELAIVEQNNLKLAILHLVEDRFSVDVTLPELEQKFAKDELFFLFGSDVYSKMLDHPWPGLDDLAKHVFLIGVRDQESIEIIESNDIKIINIDKLKAKYSSTATRHDIKQTKNSQKTVHEVIQYSNKNKLYI
jgi:nicotinate-nucleotide adenylyltransferase